jgi:uncharacterized protein
MPEVIHDEKGTRFVIATDSGEAYVPYRLEGNTVNFHYSYVPASLRGRGIGRILVEACKAWAEAQGYEIRASCGYVASMLEKLKK